MFAPGYFAPRYFGPRYFPPGAGAVVVEARKPAGVKKSNQRYREVTEDLPFPVWVREERTLEEELIIQAYLDSLRDKVERLPVHAFEYMPADKKGEDRRKRGKEQNDRLVLLMLALPWL